MLLLDEPLAGLDWRARGDIANLLGRSCWLDVAGSLSNRVYCLHCGF